MTTEEKITLLRVYGTLSIFENILTGKQCFVTDCSKCKFQGEDSEYCEFKLLSDVLFDIRTLLTGENPK